MEILSLGEKIKGRRKELNMTLKDLAGDRITPGQISLVESGKSNPSMDLLEYLAGALNISVEYLMESEESQAEKICYYYENMGTAFLLNEDFNQAEHYIQKSLYYAEKYKLEYRRAKNLYLQASIFMSKNENGMAQQLLLSANVIFIRNNCYEEIVDTFLKLGLIAIELQSYNSAYSYFSQAERVFLDNSIGNDLLIGKIYYYLAYIEFKLDNVSKSINFSFLAKEKFKKIDNKTEYGKSLLLISSEYSQKGDIKNSIKYSTMALKIFKDMQDTKYVAKIENRLGKLFYEFENFEESFEHFYKAKDLSKNQDNDLFIQTLVDLCENFIKLKEVQEAKSVLEEIFSNIKDGDNEATIKYYMLNYKVFILEEKIENAKENILLAYDLASNTEDYKSAANIAIIIGKFYIDYENNDKEAAKYLGKGVEIFKSLNILKDF